MISAGRPSSAAMKLQASRAVLDSEVDVILGRARHLHQFAKAKQVAELAYPGDDGSESTRRKTSRDGDVLVSLEAEAALVNLRARPPALSLVHYSTASASAPSHG